MRFHSERSGPEIDASTKPEKMLARLLLLLSLGACSALVLPTAGARSLALSAPRAASPMMVRAGVERWDAAGVC